MMDFKDQYPIGIFSTQTELEKEMYQLNEILEGRVDKVQIKSIKWGLQRKIDIEIQRGNWK